MPQSRKIPEIAHSTKTARRFFLPGDTRCFLLCRVVRRRIYRKAWCVVLPSCGEKYPQDLVDGRYTVRALAIGSGILRLTNTNIAVCLQGARQNAQGTSNRESYKGIFYIDNLDFGKDNFSHNIFPRVGAYNDNNLANFVERDIILKNRSPFPSYGKFKLRDRTNVCYGRCTYSPNYKIFIPVHHPHHYALYAFDMHRRKLSILDPLRDTTISCKSLDERHSKIKVVISTALAQCLKLCFPKWDEDIPNWPVEFPPNINIQENKLDCSLHVLNYMRSWDGFRLVMPSCNDPFELRKQFLANLLSFKKNEAILPEYVNRCLKAWHRK